MDYEGANTSIGSNGPHSKLIYHNDMVYKGLISSRFTLVDKGVLVIMQSYIGDSWQGLWIGLID